MRGGNGHDIFGQIIGLENLFSAWREFKKGKTGKLEIQEFALNLEDHIFQLHTELKNKTYTHSAYTEFYVNDPKLRHIHKASTRDRILHHAVFRILYSIFDRSFIHDSYSCRISKGTHKGVQRLNEFLNKASHNNSRIVYALKCDIRKFFDSIDQEILFSLIEKRIQDQNALWLIRQIVGSFSKRPNTGLPLGNVTSQLFSNIYLNELDQFIKHRLRAKYYVRYCDDFVILGHNPEILKEFIKDIERFLRIQLRLRLHSNKITIRKYRQGIDFLGYVIMPNHLTLRTKTKQRIFKKIKKGVNSPSLQSYLGVLAHCSGHVIKKDILKLQIQVKLPNFSHSADKA